ncbi:MAG: aminotransferase class III-fold pyridoxal phosphate-dependent enzyme [Gammaproteobacteria bacterium]
MNPILDNLKRIRSRSGGADALGLPDETIARFAERDPNLAVAIAEAERELARIEAEFPELLKRGEADQAQAIQDDFVNFYPDDAVNPYVPLAARGPWIVTVAGAVIHDNGGYGMLGLGHAPQGVLAAMNRPQVMANVMTPNYSQLRLARALRREIGHSHGDCPFLRFLAMNSGSEAVAVAARISDVNAKLMTDPGGRYAGRKIRHLSLGGGFHGRTERAARFSDSSRAAYRKHLASFRDHDDLWTVAPNDLAGLRSVFERAERERVFLEAFFLEPVMGEGDPGQAINPEFYRFARELTEAHGGLLLVDSIQAGLRAHGVLSIVDYPGFEREQAPDMEAYSKALNAGQFPLSVLAMNGRAAKLYRKGIYGNTMTANPRAMDVAVAVLEAVTPELRENIRRRGREFIEKFEALRRELDGLITRVQGTGLLFSCELAPEYKIFGAGSTEEYLRRHGIGVIHGGARSLRYTPHFAIGSEEVDLVVSATRDALLSGPGGRSAAALAETEAVEP